MTRATKNILKNIRLQLLLEVQLPNIIVILMHGIQRQRVIDTGLMIHQTMLMREIIPVQTQQE